MASSPPRAPLAPSASGRDVRDAESLRTETFHRLNEATTADDVQAAAQAFADTLPDDAEGEQARSELAALVTGHLARVDAQHRLDVAVRAREALMASVAHDLRNPLNTFAMSSGLLRDDLERNDVDVTRALGLAARMERATIKMQSLIEDLLEASRIDGGAVELKPKVEAAAQLARDAISASGPIAAERRAHIVADVLDETVSVRVDRARWLQGLTKAIAYAAKTTGDQGIIRLGVIKEGDSVVFVVTATIPGSAVPSTDDASRGGLNILIARGIAALHGAAFTIDGVQELSMTFTVPAV